MATGVPRMSSSSSRSRKLCKDLSVALRATLFCVAVGTSAGASGVPMPISLSKAQFNAEIAVLTAVIEDFESYLDGIEPASPFFIANGSFVSGTPRVQSSASLCGDMDQCLFDSSVTGELRTFEAFPPGTQFWGADVNLVDATDTFRIAVTGGSGILAFEASGISFAGFGDPLGLTSVEFENLGTDFGNGTTGVGNYSFDNVTTAPDPTAVSEPGAFALLGLAFAGAWAITRRVNSPYGKRGRH
jgi:MYXO-CTERM domain-containing protein